MIVVVRSERFSLSYANVHNFYNYHDCMGVDLCRPLVRANGMAVSERHEDENA